MPIKLVIADDHPIVLRGLEALFGGQPDFELAACCANGADAVDAVRHHRPDVLLIDLNMAGMSGLEVIRRLSHAGMLCRTVVLTAAARDEEVAASLDLGVAGLLLKDAPPDGVVDAVRRVARGESSISRDTLGRALNLRRAGQDTGPTPQSTLTPRELEVIKLVAEGLRNKAIAERLSISEGTVKIHLHNIYDKLGVDGRLELVLAAQQKMLV